MLRFRAELSGRRADGMEVGWLEGLIVQGLPTMVHNRLKHAGVNGAGGGLGENTGGRVVMVMTLSKLCRA